MNKKLERLHTKYHDRFSERFRGFECGIGWFPLIESMLVELQNKCPHARIVQAKEKLGGLRIYLEDKQDDSGKAILRQAEMKSFLVCEECGSSGKRIAQDGWVRVRCVDHSQP